MIEIVGKIVLLDRDTGHFGIRNNFGISFGYLDPQKQADIQLAANCLCGELDKITVEISEDGSAILRSL
jgi:hypothetical protein